MMAGTGPVAPVRTAPERSTSMSRLGRVTVLLVTAGLLTWLLPGWPNPAPAAEKSAATAAHAPFLEKSWAQPTLREQATRNVVLDQAVKALQNKGRPVINAFTPFAVGDKAIYRSFWGLHAVDLTTGKLAWEADSRWGLDAMLREAPKASYLNQWLAVYASVNQTAAVLDNSVLGSFSSDGRLVFAIDDMTVAPFGNPNQGGAMYNFGPPVADGINHNCLQAFDLTTGKLVWEHGDKAGDPEFKESYFLAAPLVLDGKLYVLNEKETRLRLVCLEPRGKVLWQIDLASFRNRAAQDP